MLSHVYEDISYLFRGKKIILKSINFSILIARKRRNYYEQESQLCLESLPQYCQSQPLLRHNMKHSYDLPFTSHTLLYSLTLTNIILNSEMYFVAYFFTNLFALWRHFMYLISFKECS